MKRIAFLFLIGSLLACNKQSDSVKNPLGYNLSSPEKLRMRDALLEISGIAFTSKDEMYALQDEEGQLYRVALSDGRILYSSRFWKKGDYEDVAVTGNHIIVLRSDGALLSFAANEVGKEISKVNFQKDVLPTGEYEGLFAKNDTIYALCKDCSKGKGEKNAFGHVLTVNRKGKIRSCQTFQISVKEIGQRLGKKKLTFRPSAFAQHPFTHDWYIISSANRLMVLTDRNWKVKDVFSLPHPLFLQPEGIAFDSKANMYISNEGDEITNGSVYKFTFH